MVLDHNFPKKTSNSSVCDAVSLIIKYQYVLDFLQKICRVLDFVFCLASQVTNNICLESSKIIGHRTYTGNDRPEWFAFLMDPANFENVWRRAPRSSDKMSSEWKINLCLQVILSLKMSGKSLKCPAKNFRFAGHFVWWVTKRFWEAWFWH